MSESCQWAFPDFPYPNIATFATDSVPETNTSPSDGTRQPQPNLSGLPQSNPTNDFQEDDGNDADRDSDDEFADPRNASKVRASRGKAPEINLVHRLIRRFLQHKGVIPVTSESSSDKKKTGRGERPEPPVVPTMPPAVDPVIVEAYCQRRHRGPTKNDMPISWTNSMQHPWNQKVIQLLTAEFKLNVKECKYQNLPVLPRACEEEDFVFSAIEAKLNRRQSILRATIRKTTQASNLSPAEVVEHLTKHYQESLVRSRRNERKRNLYIRRRDIVQDALDSPWSKDPDLWKEIQTVFDLFDEKEMSSDETETEALFGASKETRRVRKPWIDERISKIMNYIDRHYSHRTISGTLKRGNAPLRRILESKTVNNFCHPKPGLPKNIYSADLAPEVLKTLKPLEPIMLPNIPACN